MIDLILLSSNSTSLTSVKQVSDEMLENYHSLQDEHVVVHQFNLDKVHNLPDKLWTLMMSNQKKIIVAVHPELIRSIALGELVGQMKDQDEMIIHLYGDFLRQAQYFAVTSLKLIGKKIHFIVPSESFKKHISQFFLNKDCIEVIPFPVMGPDSSPKTIDRERCRSRLGVARDEMMFLYTGRFSKQKNTLQLIDLMRELEKLFPLKVFFVGKIDDFEFGTIGTASELGYMYQKIEDRKSKNMHFIDYVPAAELQSFYQAADFYISLSTYHDEDFGRSPVEALQANSKVILTDWGGYSDLLRKYPTVSFPIPVTIKSDKLVLEIKGLDQWIKTQFNIKSNHGLSVKKFFSAEVFKANIEKILFRQKSNFSGMTISYAMLAHSLKDAFYKNDQSINVKMYRDIYSEFGNF